MLRIVRNWLLRLPIFLIWSCAKSDANREKPVKNSMMERPSSSRRSGGKYDRRDGKCPVGMEIDAIEAAICGPQLVLRADMSP